MNPLSLSRTCVSNQAAIETSGSIIGSSAALCVTKQSISSLSLQIEFISSDPVECSFLRVLHDVHENSCLSGSPAVPLLLCLGPRPPGCFGLGRERVLLVFVSAFLNVRRGLFGFVLLIMRVCAWRFVSWLSPPPDPGLIRGLDCRLLFSRG